MTWSINVTGHSEESSQEAKAMEKAQEFAASLKDLGVATANFSGMHGGTHNLLEMDSALGDS